MTGLEALVALIPYVLGVALVVAVFIGLGLLRKWRDGATLPTEEMIAWAAVMAVEQMFFDKDGVFKKAEAKKFMLVYFPALDDSQLDMWIESAVKLMNDSRVIE